MQKLIVEQNIRDKKIVTYITSKYPHLSINAIHKALRNKDVKVNGKRISCNVLVNGGDNIELYISDVVLNGDNQRTKIEKIYEDENIVIINKTSNIEVVGESSLLTGIGAEYRYRPCHRIDRNTIGLVLFAKNEKTLKALEEAFKNKLIEKHYIACCYGVAKKSDTLYGYLFKDSKKSVVYISNEYKKGYSKIITSYRLIEKNDTNNACLLDVILHTGRTHQIRAHLASVGLPIIGDGKYGSYKVNKRFGQNRQALCSFSLSFSNLNNELKYLNNRTVRLAEIPESIIKCFTKK